MSHPISTHRCFPSATSIVGDTVLPHANKERKPPWHPWSPQPTLLEWPASLASTWPRIWTDSQTRAPCLPALSSDGGCAAPHRLLLAMRRWSASGYRPFSISYG